MSIAKMAALGEALYQIIVADSEEEQDKYAEAATKLARGLTREQIKQALADAIEQSVADKLGLEKEEEEK